MPVLRSARDASSANLAFTVLSRSGVHVQAVLLVGFSDEDYSHFQNVMQDMEADMVPVFCADEDTLQQTLQTALARATPGFKPAPAGAKRGVFLSGMYTAEVSVLVALSLASARCICRTGFVSPSPDSVAAQRTSAQHHSAARWCLLLCCLKGRANRMACNASRPNMTGITTNSTQS